MLNQGTMLANAGWRFALDEPIPAVSTTHEPANAGTVVEISFASVLLLE